MLSLLMVVLVVLVASAIVLGVRRAGVRAGLSEARARRIATRFGAGLAMWLAASGALAASGVLSDFTAWPPRFPVVVLFPVVALALSTRTATARALLAATPPSWLIGIQTMRIPIELVLWALAVANRFPRHLTFEGRNFDVVVGLTAPLVVWAVSRGTIGRRGLVAWNVGGLLLLANIVLRAVTSVPGPLRIDWHVPGAELPNTVVTEFPFGWLPALLVPVALLGHVLSLRQTIAEGGTPVPAAVALGSAPR
jgi:hypothetical protein